MRTNKSSVIIPQRLWSSVVSFNRLREVTPPDTRMVTHDNTEVASLSRLLQN